jgi:hypothetical protein
MKTFFAVLILLTAAATSYASPIKVLDTKVTPTTGDFNAPIKVDWSGKFKVVTTTPSADVFFVFLDGSGNEVWKENFKSRDHFSITDRDTVISGSSTIPAEKWEKVKSYTIRLESKKRSR